MEYKEAIKAVYQTHGLSVFNDRFLVRSLLSDLVGSSISDYRLVNAFYELSAYADVFTVFQDNGLNKGRELIVFHYSKLGERYTKREVVDAVNPIAELMCPEEYQKSIHVPHKINQGKAAIIIKNNPPHKKPNTPKVIVRNLPTPPPKKKRLRNVTIRTNAYFLTIGTTERKKPFLDIDGRIRDIDEDALMGGTNTMNLNLDAKGKHVKLFLRSINYDTISIVGGNTNICTSFAFDEKYRLKAKTLRIAKKYGFMSVWASAGRLVVISDGGDVNFYGGCDELDAKVRLGTFSFNLEAGSRQSVSIKAEAGKSIKGRFIDAKLRPSVHGFFRKQFYSKTTSFASNTRVNLELSAGHGIRVK